MEDVGIVSGNALKGMRGTLDRNGALVAVEATIMPDLQVERAIAKLNAATDALAAADAERLINRIFVIRILQSLSLDSTCWAKLVLSAGVQGGGLSLKVAGAQLAIAAHIAQLDTLDSRLLKDAVRCAMSALDAFGWIDLPDELLFLTAPGECRDAQPQQEKERSANAVGNEIAALIINFVLVGHTQDACRAKPALDRLQVWKTAHLRHGLTIWHVPVPRRTEITRARTIAPPTSKYRTTPRRNSRLEFGWVVFMFRL